MVYGAGEVLEDMYAAATAGGRFFTGGAYPVSLLSITKKQRLRFSSRPSVLAAAGCMVAATDLSSLNMA